MPTGNRCSLHSWDKRWGLSQQDQSPSSGQPPFSTPGASAQWSAGVFSPAHPNIHTTHPAPGQANGLRRGERLLIPGRRRKNRKNQTYCSHFRYTLASAKQLGFMGFVCLLEGGGTQVSCSELARTRWRNSVHFPFLSTYSLVKGGLAYRKQWKFLRFLKGKG